MKRICGGQFKLLISQRLYVGIVLLLLSGNSSAAETRKVSGQVLDGTTGAPLTGVTVTLSHPRRATSTDSTGHFHFDSAQVDSLYLSFSHVGYDSVAIGPLTLTTDAVTDLTVRLEPHPVSVRDIIVTPGTFAIMGNEPAPKQTLTRQDIQSIPHFGEDIYRAVTRIPGVSSNDFSARFNIRGSEHEQILALFDGLQLYEPFHLRDVDGGALSIIDIDLIRGVELMTGGFSARYGDRLGGVFSITPRSPSTTHYRATGGLSFTDARVSAEGPFAGGQGTWLVSARRGYVDLVLKLMDQDTLVSPTYYDTYATVLYRLSTRHTISANFLYANDHLKFEDKDRDTASSKYANGNFWVKLRSEFNHRLMLNSIVRVGSLSHHRNGIAYSPSIGWLELDVRDYRRFEYLQVKEDGELDLGNSVLVQAGFDVKLLEADYDYSSRYRKFSGGYYHSYTNNLRISPTGRQVGTYASCRITPWHLLIGEFGLRYDYASYSGDRIISPRGSLALRVTSTTTLRLAWGRYAQSQSIYGLDVPDGDSTFHPADIAEHRVAGIEHAFANGYLLRVEGYERRLSDLRPRYRNLATPLNSFVETRGDRARLLISREVARGIEFYIKSNTERKLYWWASYAYSRVFDHIVQYTVEDQTFYFDADAPSPIDQRHAVYVDIGYRPGSFWSINLAWQFHSGWPYTDYVIKYDTSGSGSTVYRYTALDTPYSSHYANYHRLDVRISRLIPTAYGRFSFFVEAVNLYDRANIRTFDYDVNCSGPDCTVLKTPYYWFRLLPSLGLNWEWEF